MKHISIYSKLDEMLYRRISFQLNNQLYKRINLESALQKRFCQSLSIQFCAGISQNLERPMKKQTRIKMHNL